MLRKTRPTLSHFEHTSLANEGCIRGRFNFCPIYFLLPRVTAPGCHMTPNILITVSNCLQGCKYCHDKFQRDYGPWTAFRTLDYGYTRVQVFNSSHLYLEQVSIDQVSGICIYKSLLFRHVKGLLDNDSIWAKDSRERFVINYSPRQTTSFFKSTNTGSLPVYLYHLKATEPISDESFRTIPYSAALSAQHIMCSK